MNNNSQNNRNTYNTFQNQNKGINNNNTMGGFNFNVTQNAPNTNNNPANEDEFEAVKEGNGNNQIQNEKKSGLSTLLDE